MTAAYRLPLQNIGIADGGAIGLSINYFYRDTLETQVGTGDIDHLAGEIGYPHHSGTANLTYDSDRLSLLLQGRYYGKSAYDVDEADNARDISGVGDWVVFNTTIGLKVNDRFGLKFIVDNVFDRAPPYPAPAGGGTITYFSGIVGRYFRAEANMKF